MAILNSDAILNSEQEIDYRGNWQSQRLKIFEPSGTTETNFDFCWFSSKTRE